MPTQGTTDQMINALITDKSNNTVDQWRLADFYQPQLYASQTISYALGVGDSNDFGDTQGMQAMDAQQANMARLAFQMWDDVVPLNISEMTYVPPSYSDDYPNDYSGEPDITFNISSTTPMAANGSHSTFTHVNTDTGWSVGNYYDITDAHVWLASSWMTNQDPGMVIGGYGLEAAIHEIGHTLGLQHPGNYDAGTNASPHYNTDAAYAQDQRQYTLMSYFGFYSTNSAVNDWVNDGSPNNNGSPVQADGSLDLYSQTPMLYDIAAVQALYGADHTTRSGDTVYGFNCNIGPEDTGNGNTVDESQIYDFSKNPTPIFTIWDGGGYDTIDCSGYSGATPEWISLEPGTYSDVMGMHSNIAIAFGTHIEKAIGGSSGDTFRTEAGASDTVVGGTGFNSLWYQLDTAGLKVDLQQGKVFKSSGSDTFSNIEQFYGGDGDDTFISKGDQNYTFDGGGGTNTVDYSWNTGGIKVDLTTFSVLKFGLKNTTDTIYGIQKFIGGTGPDDFISRANFNYTFDGGGGTNTLDYSWDNQGITADLWAGTVSKGAGNGTDQFSKIQKFIGGSGNDVFYGGSGTYTFDGGNGVNTLDYSSGNNFFHITVDLAQHTVTKQILGYKQTDNFTNIRGFVGTSEDDTFKSTYFDSFTFDGGDGLDNTLDYSSFQTGITVNLQQASGTVEKGQTVLPGVAGYLPITIYQTDSFSNIQHFIGGSGSDTFKIAPDSIDYTLNGGDGTDTLDYSAFTTGVTFDLQQGVVHKGTTVVSAGQNGDGIPLYKPSLLTDYFSNMEVFKGGSDDDTLIDGSGTTKQYFDGGGGNNTVVLSGNYGDYDYSASGYQNDQLWHTVVNPITSTDAPLDLVHVEQLQFGDGSSLALADHGKAYSASSLYTAIQNGAITKYQFWDSTTDPASGHFVVNGLVQAKGQAIDVSAAQLGQTGFQSGSGSNDLWVRTFDGVQWSAWKEVRVIAPIDHAPVVTALDRTVAHGAIIAATTLLSVSDADRDVMTKYQLWDSTADPASGHFVVNGAAQGAGQTIEVSAAQLAQTTFDSGSGADDLWVRAFDGMQWSAWKEVHVNAPVDSGPVVTAANVSLSKGQSAIAASSLFTASAPFRDPIATYALWDTGAGGGHFLVNGLAQATSSEIDITAAQLSQVTYQAGLGGDTLWVRANDGDVWGTWSQAFSVKPWTDSAPAVTVANARAVHGESFAASSLFGISDADGDAITKYAFWDTGTGGGHFMLNGVAQGTNQEIDVTAAQLSQLSYQSGSGADTLWVRANDGMQWSAWSSSFTVTAPIDTGPVVTPTNASIKSFANQTFAASSLIGYSDPFNSPATQYDFWNSGAGGGHFVLNGTALPTNQDNIISAAQLGRLSYQVGTGSDTLWAKANDGTVWGGWSKSFTISDPPAVAAGETITLGSAYAGAVSFLSDTGTLKLEESSSFAGTVAGLCGQDVIDLADIGFGAGSTLGYAANADHSGGTLSVGDGMHMANIALLGSYMASTFTAASDGHGGTLISEAAQGSQPTSLVTQPHA